MIRNLIGNINLNYHSSFKTICEEFKFIHNVTPQNILKQCLLLKKYFDIISIDELFDLPVEKRNGKVSITFDDAYDNIFDDILIQLSENSIPSTVFIIGNSFNKKPYWRDKIIYLENNTAYLNEFIEFLKKETGIKFNPNNFFKKSKNQNINSYVLDNHLDKFINMHKLNNNIHLNLITNKKKLIKNKFVKYGNHTLNHYVMSSLSYKEQKKEISENKKILSKLGVETTDVFALPFGTYNDLNTDTIKVLEELGINKILMLNNLINNKKNQLIKNNIEFSERFAPTNNIYRFICNIAKLGFFNQKRKISFL